MENDTSPFDGKIDIKEVWQQTTPNLQEICIILLVSNATPKDLELISLIGEYDLETVEQDLQRLLNLGIVERVSYINVLQNEISKLEKNPQNIPPTAANTDIYKTWTEQQIQYFRK